MKSEIAAAAKTGLRIGTASALASSVTMHSRHRRDTGKIVAPYRKVPTWTAALFLPATEGADAIQERSSHLNTTNAGFLRADCPQAAAFSSPHNRRKYPRHFIFVLHLIYWQASLSLICRIAVHASNGFYGCTPCARRGGLQVIHNTVEWGVGGRGYWDRSSQTKSSGTGCPRLVVTVKLLPARVFGTGAVVFVIAMFAFSQVNAL